MVLNLLEISVEGNMIYFVFQSVYKIKINFPCGYKREREETVM